MECPSPQYLAGYFDGEGCISVNYSIKPERFRGPETAYQIMVSVSNTYKPVLEAIHGKYGGWLGNNGNHRNPGHRKAYQWRATGRRAAHFLTDIEPYLVEKRGRAIAALFFCDTITWPKNWREVAPEGIHLRKLVLRYMESNPNIRGTGLCPAA